jgi:methionyl-tRNA formyltransferase
LGDSLKFIIATSKNWRPGLPQNVSRRTGSQVSLISESSDLTRDHLDKIGATRIFFPHWSTIIPSEIYERYECIIFHMTDLPFGRGGSPLQNLIARGIAETKISAFRCVKELDAGPVYLKAPLSLDGTAQEIYVRASKVVEEMIVAIIQNQPEPQEQSGEVVVFQRRKKEDGNIAGLTSLEKAYDYIRMLDAEGYPRAFIETDNFRFEFSNSSIKNDKLLADVIVKPRSNEKP